jgi:hypothetical protein
MSAVSQSPAFFIGWDVGGWNCDKNPVSRDAIVILDNLLAIVGQPWRGNLRTNINAAANAREWVAALFARCGATLPSGPVAATLAIDTPLGFSQSFTRLVAGRQSVGPVEKSHTNAYLFRRTEHWLFEQGLSPLSAVKDMIGSQATKGMHVLARFTPIVSACGVWTDGALLTAIEAYPAACRSSASLTALRVKFPALGHGDLDDALTCALIAHLHATKPEILAGPDADVPASEGWIWLPKDALPAAPRNVTKAAAQNAPD